MQPPVNKLPHQKPTKKCKVPKQEKMIQIDLSSKKISKVKVITDCQHTDRKVYAKGMCNYCYHMFGRNFKLATACKHKNRKAYAKNKCNSCYQMMKPYCR